MKTAMKRWLRPWIPPALLSVLRRPAMPGISFRGDYQTWGSALSAADGYDKVRILEKVKDATAKVERGDAAYERDSVLFDSVEISWPVLSGLLWAAARDGGHLSVLDFGGSLGTTYRQNKQFLNHLVGVRWGVVEQSHYVACGRENFSGETLRFFETIRSCVDELRPNVAVFGAALQYVAEPFSILTELDDSPATVMIVDRTPFSNLAEDRITVQHVAPSIYDASYPSWVFSEEGFRNRIRSRWNIAASFDCSEGSSLTDTGLQLTFRGLILTR